MKRVARLLFSIAAVLGVVFALAPTRALAADPRPYTREVYVNGVSLADQSVSGVSYDPDYGELTLNNYRGGPIMVSSSDGRAIDVTIVLKGTNIITCTGAGQRNYGIFVAGGQWPRLCITSSSGGSLNVNATYSDSTPTAVNGINCTGEILIDGNAFVKITVSGGSSNSTLYGIACGSGNLSVQDYAQLIIEMSASSAKYCCGASAEAFIVSSTLNQSFELRGVSGCSTYGVKVFGSGKPFVFSNAPVIQFNCDAPCDVGYQSASFPTVDYYSFTQSYTVYQAHTYTNQQTSLTSSMLTTFSPTSFTYYGGHNVPTIVLKSGSTTLREGTDYTVSYGAKGNINAGTVTCTITGKGAYKGTITKTYTVNPLNLNNSYIEVEEIPPQQLVSGGAKPKLTVVFHGQSDITLVEGTDYTLSYSNNTSATLNAKCTITGNGNYTGSRTVTFSIVAPTTYSINVIGGIAKDEGATTITSAAAGTIVNLSYDTPPADNEIFYWQVTQGDVTIKMGSNTFTMPAGNVTVRAIYATNRFRDVKVTTPHVLDILWLAETGISEGWKIKDSSGNVVAREFRPSNTVIRQDMAAFLFRLAVLSGQVSDSWQPSAATKTRFTDVNSKTPHCREIWWLAESGISTGWAIKDSSGNVVGYEFRPTSNVTRQDMAAFLHRLAEGPKATYTPTSADRTRFSDVNDNTPHAADIWWLANTGVTTGYSDGTFRGMNTVIRQDMAAFLHRMYDKGLVKPNGMG